MVGGPLRESSCESCGGGGVPAGVEVAVAENEPTADGAWKEVAVNEDEPLRTRLGGGMAEAMIPQWNLIIDGRMASASCSLFKSSTLDKLVVVVVVVGPFNPCPFSQ